MAQWPGMSIEGFNSEDPTHLQRLLRITEGDWKAYCQDTKVTLLKQRKIIHKLECERQDILAKFQNGEQAESRSRKRDYQMIAKGFEAYHCIKTKVQEKNHLIQCQKSQIQCLEKEISKLHCSCRSFQRQRQPNDFLKRVQGLEDKLENACIRYNSIVHRNCQLREKIEHLIIQRATYERISKQLNETLKTYERQVSKLTTEATTLYDKREESYQKFKVLKASQVQDRRLCEAQLQEAQRMSHLQINIMNFMAAKHRKRVEYGSQAQLDNIQEAYSALMNGTEVEKSANFELFTYCSNLNNKMEDLQKDILKLREDVNAWNLKGSQLDDVDQVKITSLEEEISATINEVSEAEIKLSLATKTLSELKCGVEAMLRLVGGDVSLASILDSRQVDDDQISKPALMRALEEIENQVNALLQTRQFVEIQEHNFKEQDANIQMLMKSEISGGNSPQVRSFQVHRISEEVDGFAMDFPSAISESGVDQFSLPNGSGPLLSYVRLADENYTKSSKSSDSVGYLSGLPAKLTPS